MAIKERQMSGYWLLEFKWISNHFFFSRGLTFQKLISYQNEMNWKNSMGDVGKELVFRKVSVDNRFCEKVQSIYKKSGKRFFYWKKGVFLNGKLRKRRKAPESKWISLFEIFEHVGIIHKHLGTILLRKIFSKLYSFYLVEIQSNSE